MSTNTLKKLEIKKQDIRNEVGKYKNSILDLKMQYKKLQEEKFKVMYGIELGNVISYKDTTFLYLGASAKYFSDTWSNSDRIELRRINKNGDLSKIKKTDFLLWKNGTTDLVKLYNSYEEFKEKGIKGA